MTVKYVAYIDEFGDPGLSGIKPRVQGGASEWLVLGCTLVKVENDKLLVSWVREILTTLRLPQSKFLHFANLSPGKQKLAAKMLAAKNSRAFVVASNKQNIEYYENPNLKSDKRQWYYWWMTRLLLERVTHFLGTHHPDNGAQEAPVKLRVVFSQRGRASHYQLFNEYLTKIYWQSKFKLLYLNEFDLDWSFIDFEEIFVLPHQQRAGLQLADVVAGSFYQAIERDRPADCDPTCAVNLRPILAKDKTKNHWGTA